MLMHAAADVNRAPALMPKPFFAESPDVPYARMDQLGDILVVMRQDAGGRSQKCHMRSWDILVRQKERTQIVERVADFSSVGAHREVE